MKRRTVTKRDISERIAANKDLGLGVTIDIIQSFLDEIVLELSKGNRIEFRDFGVFESVTRKPRLAQNPKTLEKIRVNAKVAVKFKVGRQLREKVLLLTSQTDNA